MRNLFALFILAVLFTSPAVTTSAQAADSKKGAPPAAGGGVVEGKVSCEKSGDKITAVKIKTDKGEIVHVTMDELGQKVGKDYDLIRVYVKGKVETKDKEKWVTVTQIGEGTKRKK